jgi:hypothetical protein
LVEHHDPEGCGIERPPLTGLRSGARPAVKNDDRQTPRVAAFLDMELVPAAHRNTVMTIGLNLRIERFVLT